VANYAGRGRKFAGLAIEALEDQWRTCLRAMADDPLEKQHRDLRGDLEAEFDLRELDPPYDSAKVDLDRFFAEADKLIEQRMADPEERERMIDDMHADLDAFREGTENSN
jgi:hypothetical protein